MLIVALGCIAGSIGLLVFLLAGRLAPAAVAVPADLPEEIAADVAAPEEVSALLNRFAGLTRKLTPASYADRLQHRLDVAGNPRGWAAERVLALKGVGLVAGLVLGALIGARHGVLLALFAAVLGAAGFLAPDMWIRSLGERRNERVIRELPDATDMMTVCVEAGLGFDAALSRVARTMPGPVAEEFARVLQEMQFGLSRAEALRAMNARTDVAQLRNFATALVQASELGISVGDVLREQARELRIKRRQRAEEKAQKLPVKTSCR
jgi:tight adherence protein C